MSSALETLASDAVARALQLGASDAECIIAEGDEFSASLRMREIESLKEAGSRAAGIRVLLGEKGAQHTGSSYTSDLTAEGIEKMIRAAIDLAAITSVDPFAGLPEREELGRLNGDLGLYDPAITEMDTAWKIEQARIAEDTALNFDARIQNSEGAGFSSGTSLRVFANSRGFVGSYASSSCSLSVVPVARSNGEGAMERDYWYTTARSAAKLESAESVGRIAAQNPLRGNAPLGRAQSIHTKSAGCV